MERGEFYIPNVGTIKSGDLDMSVSSGLILRTNLRDALKIRQLVEERFGEDCIVYTTVSTESLFLVKFKDLSPQKQMQLERKKH